MLKIVVLHDILVETVIQLFFQDALNINFKRTELVCNINLLFTVTFDQMNASLLNKIVYITVFIITLIRHIKLNSCLSICLCNYTDVIYNVILYSSVFCPLFFKIYK